MDQTWTIDDDLGEALQENEEQVTQAIVAAIVAHIKEGPRPARRDAHPKAHGCVEAEFRVDSDVPPHLAQGVLVPGKGYRAWIRFSNGFPDMTQPDATPDVRGMAIKLLGVPGDKLLADEYQSQDFVLMSHPVFFADDAARYLKFFQWAVSNNWLKKHLPFLKLDVRGAFNAAMMNKKVASPLETRYWSEVPYRLGEGTRKQAVKYSARPRPFPGSAVIPRHPQPNFLRETMIRQLAAGDAHFDFLVQPRAGAMSVENSRVEWKESAAPFIKVATITLPRQQFATDERDKLGEDLSFTPWHALPAHRPLGAVNRIRRIVYQTISELRHKLNEEEPSLKLSA